MFPTSVQPWWKTTETSLTKPSCPERFRSGAADIIVNDQPSQDTYGIQSISMTSRADNESDALALGLFVIHYHRAQRLRLTRLTVQPQVGDGGIFSGIFQLDVWSVIQVNVPQAGDQPEFFRRAIRAADGSRRTRTTWTCDLSVTHPPQIDAIFRLADEAEVLAGTNTWGLMIDETKESPPGSGMYPPTAGNTYLGF